MSDIKTKTGTLDADLLEKTLKNGETSTVEFKVAPPRAAELAQRICGFANAQGGFLIIGVADKTWDVVGVKDTSQAIDIILQAARLCKPTVSFDPPHPDIITVDNKQIVVANVVPGQNTLYQAGGVFWVRRGTHTVALELDEIGSLLYSRGTLRWERLAVQRATMDDLNMSLVQLYLNQRPDRNRLGGRLDNVNDVLVNLGCATITRDEAGREVVRPTNAGMLLFGYTPQQFILQAQVVCTLYSEGDSLGLRRYADRRILHGTISEQIEQAEAFFRQYIPAVAIMDGFRRVELPELPLEALREAVVNALVHRDYSLEGENVRIFYYTKNRVEIHNPGTLLPGLAMEELMQGRARSTLRNPVIAGVLRDSPQGYMEQVGSGINYMINQMRRNGNPEPEFKLAGEFVVTFLSGDQTGQKPEKESLPPVVTSAQEVVVEETPVMPVGDLSQEERQTIALQYVHKNGSITNRRYRELTGTSEATALRDLDMLVEQGSLRAVGEKRGRRYVL